MLSIDIEYLSGVCYAAEIDDDSAAEWPPSPDRLFSALVDSMASRADGRGVNALRWLEEQGPPDMLCPPHSIRSRREFWVPVQDRKGGGRYLNGAGPGMAPVARKPRWFPAVVLPDGECTVTMSWKSEPSADIVSELADLAAGVPRLGHSASLVRIAVGIARGPQGRMRFVPDRNGVLAIRCPYRGRLDYLLDGYGQAEKEGVVWHPSPPSDWPRYTMLGGGLAQQYSPVQSPMGGRWTVLAIASGALAAESFPAVARAVRSAIVLSATGPAPEAISGRDHECRPSRRPHMAIVPMLNVGWRHSDGALFGLAAVMPSGTSDTSPEAKMLDRAVAQLVDTDAYIGLRGGFRMSLEPADGRLSLQASRYTRASRNWATATPIAIDRHARRGRDPGPGIADSVERLGLPRPSSVRVSRGGMMHGVSHAAKWVRHAGRGGLWHASIGFDQAVRGPVIIGAGRYRGLGLCLPAEEDAGDA